MVTLPKRPLLVSGFMATGKSSAGAAAARALGVPFVDTDALLEHSSGKTVAALFATEGEARFREREAELLGSMLDDPTPRVIAVGGGTMTIRRLRHAALERASVVTLTAEPATVLARAGTLTSRPNLATRVPLDRIEDLLAIRAEAYGECHATIATDELAVDAIGARLASVAHRDLVAVPLGARSYTVELAHDAPALAGEALASLAPSSILVITDDNVARERRAWITKALASLSAPRHEVTIRPGEISKDLGTVSRLWDEALARGLDRDAVVVAIGGGVVGDLAGFVAATLLRGVRCLQIPTSLLAMVDSSVGGKTGFDHAAGKNLIGAIVQPSHVLVDLDHLATLPARERAAGLAEVVKIALVADVALLEQLERDAEALATGDVDALYPVVRAAIAAKARVVRDDEREAGARALLNVGHTIGHALEAHGGYRDLLHGEAVAVGTVIEARACERLGLSPTGTSTRACQLFERLGLPVSAPADDVEAAFPFVLADKKRAATSLRLPVVTAPGAGKVVRIEVDQLRAAVLASTRATP